MKKSVAIKTMVTIFALAAFASCSKSSDSNNSPIPDNLNMEGVISAQPLTDAQKQEIRSFKSANLPSSSLYLYPQDQAQADAYSRQQQVAALAADQKAIYDSEESNCQFQMAPSTSIDDNSYSNGYNAGSQASLNYTMTSSGASCPILTQIDGTSSQTILASNFAAAQAAGSANNLNVDSQMTVKTVDNETVQSADLQKQTGMLSSSMETDASGTISIRNAGSSDGTMGVLMNLSMNGKMNLVGGKQMTFVGSGQTLAHGSIQGGNSSAQAYLKVILTYPSSLSATVQIYLKGGQMSVYVNGVQMSDADFKDLFGSGININAGGNSRDVNFGN